MVRKINDKNFIFSKGETRVGGRYSHGGVEFLGGGLGFVFFRFFPDYSLLFGGEGGLFLRGRLLLLRAA